MMLHETLICSVISLFFVLPMSLEGGKKEQKQIFDKLAKMEKQMQKVRFATDEEEKDVYESSKNPYKGISQAADYGLRTMTSLALMVFLMNRESKLEEKLQREGLTKNEVQTLEDTKSTIKMCKYLTFIAGTTYGTLSIYKLGMYLKNLANKE